MSETSVTNAQVIEVLRSRVAALKKERQPNPQAGAIAQGRIESYRKEIEALTELDPTAKYREP